MNIVKVTLRPNGQGLAQAMIGIPINLYRDLPEGVTHMTVERTSEGFLYKPIVINGTKGKT